MSRQWVSSSADSQCMISASTNRSRQGLYKDGSPFIPVKDTKYVFQASTFWSMHTRVETDRCGHWERALKRLPLAEPASFLSSGVCVVFFFVFFSHFPLPAWVTWSCNTNVVTKNCLTAWRGSSWPWPQQLQLDRLQCMFLWSVRKGWCCMFHVYFRMFSFSFKAQYVEFLVSICLDYKIHWWTVNILLKNR